MGVTSEATCCEDNWAIGDFLFIFTEELNPVDFYRGMENLSDDTVRLECE